MQDKNIIENLKNDIDDLVIRDFIKKNLKDYKENQVYIIYDGSKIEVFDNSIFNINKNFGHFKSYYISKPIVFL